MDSSECFFGPWEHHPEPVQGLKTIAFLDDQPAVSVVYDWRSVYHSRWFEIEHAQIVTPTGQDYTWERILSPPGVVVLPLLDRDRVVLIRNMRYAVETNLWELPAGLLEENEPHQDCAARELEEETGWKAETITPLSDFWASPALLHGRLYGFLAQGLIPGERHGDGTEAIEVHEFHLDTVLEMIRSNEIQDAKTIALLLHYEVFVRRDPGPKKKEN